MISRCSVRLKWKVYDQVSSSECGTITLSKGCSYRVIFCFASSLNILFWLQVCNGYLPQIFFKLINPRMDWWKSYFYSLVYLKVIYSQFHVSFQDVLRYCFLIVTFEKFKYHIKLEVYLAARNFIFFDLVFFKGMYIGIFRYQYWRQVFV